MASWREFVHIKCCTHSLSFESFDVSHLSNKSLATWGAGFTAYVPSVVLEEGASANDSTSETIETDRILSDGCRDDPAHLLFMRSVCSSHRMVRWKVGHSQWYVQSRYGAYVSCPMSLRNTVGEARWLTNSQPTGLFYEAQGGKSKDPHPCLCSLPLVGCTESNTRFEPSLTATCRRRPLGGGLFASCQGWRTYE